MTSHNQTGVFIVDDDFLVTEMVEGMLLDMGFDCVGKASTGREAVTKTCSLRPDVILMDIEMPGMDGLKATREIQACCPTAVVVLTAYESRALTIASSEAGVAAYLMKPPSALALERAILIAKARMGNTKEHRRLHDDLLTGEQEDDGPFLKVFQNFREAVIHRSAEGVCVCHDTPDFPFVKFTLWNDRMIEITGYQMDEINRQGWYQTMYPDPEVQARARERMDRMREGADLRFERWEVQCADGVKRPIGISTSVLVTADGSTHVLGLIHDLSPQEALLEEMRRAKTDELTGARNRRGFEEEAGVLIQLARRKRLPVTAAFVDVNSFKALNDTRGHSEGDQALRAVGRELQDSVRSLDVVGRLGGDEFALVLAGVTALRAKEIFVGIAQRLSDMSKRSEWPVSFALGVVTYSGDVPVLSEVVTDADRVMYRAKEFGGTRVEYEEVLDDSEEGTCGTDPAEEKRNG